MKKILVLNSGSSSVKYQLFETSGENFKVIAKGLAGRIGLHSASVSIETGGQNKFVKEIDLPNHEIAVKEIFELLRGRGLKDISELSAVGHRMGHGGEYFDKSVLINSEVMDKIYGTMDLLPLHGAAFVHGIEAVAHLHPDLCQVATFDSAFHQTMPKEAFLYPLPMEQYEKYRIRRYGFHGTSHRYVSEQAEKMLGYAGKFVSCHLGNGSSVTAIDQGKSVDTSMGFTPLTGLMMGTRCGDIDAYVPLHIMKTQHKSLDEVNTMLNRESGFYGLSRGLSDLRDIEQECLAGNQDALVAVDTYVHGVIKHIGAYIAVLGGIDALIFTAGIGENSSFIRKKICSRLAYLGIELDEEANHRRGEAVEITKSGCLIRVLVIPTNEELMIARDTYAIISGVQSFSAVA